MRAVAVMADSNALAAPSIEAGVQTVSVQASGTIELKTPQ
jgi:predicted secreted protein